MKQPINTFDEHKVLSANNISDTDYQPAVMKQGALVAKDVSLRPSRSCLIDAQHRTCILTRMNINDCKRTLDPLHWKHVQHAITICVLITALRKPPF